jgi:hypothetical protein
MPMPETKFQNLDGYLDHHAKQKTEAASQYAEASHYNEYISLKLDVTNLCMKKLKEGSEIVIIDGKPELEIKIGDDFFTNLEMALVELGGSLNSLAHMIKHSLNLDGPRETDIKKIVGELDEFPSIKERIEELLENDSYKRFDEYRDRVTHERFFPGLRTVKDASVSPPVTRKILILFLSNPENPPYSWDWKLPDKEDIKIVSLCKEVYRLITAAIEDIKDRLLTELSK